MNWSLSEFLNLIELRSQCWCLVDMAEDGGLMIPHNEALIFQLVLSGTARVTGVRGGDIELGTGDIAMILAGDAHSVRNQRCGETIALDFLNKAEYADVPPTFALGRGATMTKLLCGRMKIRWPGGQQPRSIPPVLQARSTDGVLNLRALTDATKGNGATAVLTHIASALFVSVFRDHPACVALFRYPGVDNPISRARRFMQIHPFQEWTIERLAKKVGMGRSNFAARFVAEVGRTPMEVLIEERMGHAATFLQKSDLKVSEISARIGYHSPAAFNRRFTEHFGMTPGQMRREARSNGQN
jgi:AraC family transcriptional activator of mtrCDE